MSITTRIRTRSAARRAAHRAAVLAGLRAYPDNPLSGYQLSRDLHMRSAPVYAALAYLERTGEVESFWEFDPDAEPSRSRPPRRFYRANPNHQESTP